MSHLDIESPTFQGKPHLWIQWKGTDVCCDIHCSCGYFGHYDGAFFYFFRCPVMRPVSSSPHQEAVEARLVKDLKTLGVEK